MTEVAEYKPPPIKLTLSKPHTFTYASEASEALGAAAAPETPSWSTLQYNPTTTVHEGGTVLKFKFGYGF